MYGMSEAKIADQDFARRTLEAAHQEYNQGIWVKNPAHLLAFYVKWTAPDFEERNNPKGHVTTREEMLALMAQVVTLGSLGGFGTILEAISTISELVPAGDNVVAVVVNKYRYHQTDTEGWYGISGEAHEIETSGRWRETWVKTDQGWRFQISQLLGNQTYVDGILFTPKQSG